MKNIKELIDHVQLLHPEYKLGDVEIVVRATIRGLATLLAEGESISLPDIGTFRATTQVVGKKFPIKCTHYYLKHAESLSRALRKLHNEENKPSRLARNRERREKNKIRKAIWWASLTEEQKQEYELRKARKKASVQKHIQ